MDTSPETFKNYRCPFFVIQGGLDKVVHPMGAIELYQQSPLKEDDKEMLFYEHMWHSVWM